MTSVSMLLLETRDRRSEGGRSGRLGGGYCIRNYMRKRDTRDRHNFGMPHGKFVSRIIEFINVTVILCGCRLGTCSEPLPDSETDGGKAVGLPATSYECAKSSIEKCSA